MFLLLLLRCFFLFPRCGFCRTHLYVPPFLLIFVVVLVFLPSSCFGPNSVPPSPVAPAHNKPRDPDLTPLVDTYSPTCKTKGLVLKVLFPEPFSLLPSTPKIRFSSSFLVLDPYSSKRPLFLLLHQFLPRTSTIPRH